MQRRGLEIPTRIAIANSDDSELIQNMVPMVTSIHYPRYEIGVKAAEIVVQRSRDGRTEPQVQDVGFSVVKRAST